MGSRVGTSRLRDLAGRAIRHPVAFLGLVNGLCIAIGLAQLATLVVLLPVTSFAVIGVLMAINGIVANLVDVRLSDLTTRLYFSARSRDGRQARDVLAAGLWLQGALGAVIGLVVAAAGLMLAHRLVEQPVKAGWVAAVAVFAAVQYAIAPVGVHLRLMESFRASGLLRLATTLAGSGLVAVLVVLSPGLDSYFLAVALGAVLQLALSLAAAHAVTRRTLGASSLAAPGRAAFEAHAGARAFLASGWLIGTAKAMTRSGDVLVLAAFTGDATTGIYRIARQASDTLFTLSDAIHQFYTPTIVAAASRHDDKAVRRLRWRVAGLGAAVALMAVAGTLLVLGPLAGAWVPHLVPVIGPFATLVGLLAITIGIHGWLWPLLVVSGDISAFSLLSLAGAGVHLGAMLLLGWTGQLDATTAACAMWLSYFAIYVPLLMVRYRRRIARARAP